MTAIGAILDAKRAEIESLRGSAIFSRTRVRVHSSFRGALERSGLSVIAEIKRSSPSTGELGVNPADLLAEYSHAGADALSILSDRFFGMSADAFEELAAATTLPVLRKDFILSREQILESWIRGADAILLIASFLSPNELDEFGSYAEELGMDVLYEVHEASEVGMLPARAEIVGINNRNLKDGAYTTDTELSARMLGLLPAKSLKVAESGFDGGKKVPAGYDALLIGTGLIREFARGGSVSRLISGLKERDK